MLACAVALVLLLDASGSINQVEWQLQRDGTAEALADQAVTGVIERQGAVAVTAIAFAEATAPLVPWRVLRGAEDAAAFAAALRAAPRQLDGGTRIGHALEQAGRALDEVPCAAEQEVVDVASDGGADERSTREARDALAARGVRVNALGVGTLPGLEPADWLRDNAVTPGGFALSAEGWEGFARAMRRKLTMELASATP